MRPRARWGAAAVAIVLAALLAAPPVRAGDWLGPQRPSRVGVPDGAPVAAFGAAPVLPAPAGWPFPEAFPRTSGTGRLAGGALEWSDFVYDDHGASGIPVGSQMAAGSRWTGTYTYADPAAHGNGADIFRVGVGLDDDMTYWRVDWVTLEDPSLPVVAFGLGRADLVAAPVAWPAGAGVRTAGLAATIVASSRGAWVIDAVTGRRTPVASIGGHSSADTAAKSFVVAVPRRALPPAEKTRVWSVSGLANADGTGFEPVSPAQGARPGQPAVYNAAFRTYAHERPTGNAWLEDGQAAALAAGDITAYAADVEWARLARRDTTPEPRPTGYSNRWYVSSISPGIGVVTGGTSSNDATSNLAGRILPYGVFVPSAYTPGRPAPVTWMLHALGYMHNQYGDLSPKYLQLACEDRRSICVSPSGRSPSNPWYADAELDLWEVWRDLAESYTLDRERTVLSGYSMGGLGTFRIGLAYPSVFAQAVAIAGGLDCGVYATHGVGIPGAGQPCMGNGDFTKILPSARWLPIVLGTNAADELSPAANAVQRTQEIDALGYRYRLEIWTAQDHLVPLATDGFASVAKAMTLGARPRDPGRVTYVWYPNLVHPTYGLGPTTVYWLGSLTARSSDPGVTATVDAASEANPDPGVTVDHSDPALVDEPGEVPKVVTEATWALGSRPIGSNRVSLQLTNVGTVTVDGPRAGLRRNQPAVIAVSTDGPAIVTTRLSLPARTRADMSPASCAEQLVVEGGTVRFTATGGRCQVTLTPPAR